MRKKRMPLHIPPPVQLLRRSRFDQDYEAAEIVLIMFQAAQFARIRWETEY